MEGNYKKNLRKLSKPKEGFSTYEVNFCCEGFWYFFVEIKDGKLQSLDKHEIEKFLQNIVLHEFASRGISPKRDSEIKIIRIEKIDFDSLPTEESASMLPEPKKHFPIHSTEKINIFQTPKSKNSFFYKLFKKMKKYGDKRTNSRDTTKKCKKRRDR